MQNGGHKASEPHGTALTDELDIVYNIDNAEDGEAQSQLEVQPGLALAESALLHNTASFKRCCMAYGTAVNACAPTATVFAQLQGNSHGGWHGLPGWRQLLCMKKGTYEEAAHRGFHLQVLPITVYNSDFVLALRRQIAVSDRFICYALKQGHIRVLSTKSAHRSLVKAHAPPLTDMQCAPAPVPRCARCAAPCMRCEPAVLHRCIAAVHACI